MGIEELGKRWPRRVNTSFLIVKYRNAEDRDRALARQFWLVAFSFVKNNEGCTAEMLREYMERFKQYEELPPELIDEITAYQVDSAYETGILRQINNSKHTRRLLQEAGFTGDLNAQDKTT